MTWEEISKELFGKKTAKRFTMNEGGYIWDNKKPISQETVLDKLNELHEENKKLRTLNYVNKEAVRLNNIKTVKIGKEDVNCTNINWKLLYELYHRMIDFYYDESGDLE